MDSRKKKALEDGIQREKEVENELKEKHAAKFKEIDLKQDDESRTFGADPDRDNSFHRKELNDSIEVKESTWHNKKALV